MCLTCCVHARRRQYPNQINHAGDGELTQVAGDGEEGLFSVRNNTSISLFLLYDL